MCKWTVLFGVVLLLQLVTAAPEGPDGKEFEKKRNAFKEQVIEEWIDYLKFFINERYDFIKSLKLDDNEEYVAENAEEFTDYKNFLDEAKKILNNKTANHTLYVQCYRSAKKLEIMELVTVGIKEKYYEKCLSQAEREIIRFLRFAEKLSQPLQKYLDGLTVKERKHEVQLIFWHDRWMHVRELETRFNSIPELIEILENHLDSDEALVKQVFFLFKKYTEAMLKIVRKTEELELITELKNIKELIEANKYDVAFADFIKFYAVFDKWLINKGPSRYYDKFDSFQYTFRFFEDVDHYYQLYLQHGFYEPVVPEWFEELLKTENFKQTFEKFLILFEN